MFARIVLLFVALVAFTSAFAPSARFARKSALADTNSCDEYKKDKKGSCPGDTGYVSFVKEDTPKDFAAYNAELKAKKVSEAAAKGLCDQYKIDKNGRCPGDTGYVSFVKEDVPQDFAAYAAEIKAKKAAAAAAAAK